MVPQQEVTGKIHVLSGDLALLTHAPLGKFLSIWVSKCGCSCNCVCWAAVRHLAVMNRGAPKPAPKPAPKGKYVQLFKMRRKVGGTVYPKRHTPPPLAHARPCLSTGWALNRRFEEILGPLFLWSRMEDWVSVERLYRERGAHSCL